MTENTVGQTFGSDDNQITVLASTVTGEIIVHTENEDGDTPIALSIVEARRAGLALLNLAQMMEDREL